MPIYESQGKKYNIPEDKVEAFLTDKKDAKLLDSTPYYLSRVNSTPDISESKKNTGTPSTLPFQSKIGAEKDSFPFERKTFDQAANEVGEQFKENPDLLKHARTSGFWNTYIGDYLEKTAAGSVGMEKNALGVLSKAGNMLSDEGMVGAAARTIAGPVIGTALKYSKDFLADSAEALKGYEQKLDERSDRYNGKDFLDLYKKGDYAGMTGEIFLQAARSLPQTLLAAFSGPAGLAAIGITSANEKYDQLDENTDLNEVQKTASALLTAASEVLNEFLFGSVPVGKWIKSVYQSVGKEAATSQLQKGLSAWMQKQFKDKGILLAPFAEGASGWSSQVATNVFDKALGVAPGINIFDGAFEAFTYEAAGGAQFSAAAIPGLIHNANGRRKIKNEYKSARTALSSAFPDTAEAVLSEVDGVVTDSGISPGLQALFAGVSRNADLNEEQHKAVLDYAIAKRKADALSKGEADEIEQAKQEAVKIVTDNVNPDMGGIVSARLGGYDTPVQIARGSIVQHEDGSIDREKSSQEIYYIDEQGETKVAPIAHIEALEEMMPEEQAMEEAQAARVSPLVARQENDAVRAYQAGEAVTVLMGGAPRFGQLTASNEDGTYTFVDKETMQEYFVEPREIINEDNLSGINQGDEVAYVDEQGEMQTGVVEDLYNFRNQSGVMISGELVPVANVSPIAELQQLDAELSAELQESAPLLPGEQSQSPSAPFIEQIPKDEKGNLQFEQAPVETSIKALSEVYEDPAELSGVVDAAIQSISKQMSKAASPKPTGDITKDIANKQAAKQQIQDLSARMEYWDSLKEAILSTTQQKEESENSPSLQGNNEVDRKVEEATSHIRESEMPASSAREVVSGIERKQEQVDALEETPTIHLNNEKKHRPVNRNTPFQRRLNAVKENIHSVRDHILFGIASGAYKFQWKDKGVSVGVARELGLSGSETERKARIGLLSTNGYTPMSLAHHIWEETGMELNDNDIRSEVIDVLSSITSRKQAIEALENSAGITEEQYLQQESDAYDYEQEWRAQEEYLLSEVMEQIDEEVFLSLQGKAVSLAATLEQLEDVHTPSDFIDLIEQLEYGQQEQASDRARNNAQTETDGGERNPTESTERRIAEGNRPREAKGAERQDSDSTGDRINLSPQEPRVVNSVYEKLVSELSNIAKNAAPVVIAQDAEGFVNKLAEDGANAEILNNARESLELVGGHELIGGYIGSLGKVYIISDRVDPSDFAKIWLHENIHKALKDMYGSDRGNVLTEVYKELGEKAIRELVPERYFNEERSRSKLAEEYIARLSEEVTRGRDILTYLRNRNFSEIPTGIISFDILIDVLNHLIQNNSHVRHYDRIHQRDGSYPEHESSRGSEGGSVDSEIKNDEEGRNKSRRKGNVAGVHPVSERLPDVPGGDSAGRLGEADQLLQQSEDSNTGNLSTKQVEIARAEAETDTNPTEAQKEAGNRRDEKDLRIEKLRASKPVEITGEEITPSDDLKQYKKNALEYGKGLRGKYVNKDTGEEVMIGKNGIKEVLNHDFKNVEQLQSVAAIPQVIENSIYIDSIKNTDKKVDADKFDYYVCGLKIGSVDYTIRSVFVTLKDGTRYYDHKLTQIEKGKLIDSLIGTTPGFNQKIPLNSEYKDKLINEVGALSTTLPSVDKTALSGIKDKRLVSILQNNSSKFTDKNGDPLVDQEDVRFQSKGDGKFQDVEAFAAVNASFNEQLQQQIAGTLPKGHVYQLGDPSELLQSAGIPNLPIELSSERLERKSSKDYKRNHPFELSEIKNLPDAINNPIAVFDSTKKDDSKVILTELLHNGSHFVVVMRMQYKGRGRGRIEINDVKSMYPKDHVKGIMDWINSDDNLLRYVDKEKALNFISVQSTHLIGNGNNIRGLDSSFSKQRYHSAEVRKRFNHNWITQQQSNSAEVAIPVKDFNTATNIVTNFENPKFQQDKNHFLSIGAHTFKALIERLKQTGLARDVVADKAAFDAKLEEIEKELIDLHFMRTNVGKVYGFVTPDGTVYLDPTKMNANTPIHEFGHLWNTFIKENQPELWHKGVELIKQSDYWKLVNENPAYASLSEEQKADEALAMAIGDKGEAVWNSQQNLSLYIRIKGWLYDMWGSIKQALGISEQSDVSDLTLSDFTDATVKDLLSGEKLSGNNFDTSTNNRKFASYEDKGNEARMGDNRAMGGSALGSLVGGSESRSGIYKTLQASNSAGSVSAVYEAEELEELGSRGINPYWDKAKFRKALTEHAIENGVLLEKSYLDDKTLLHDQRKSGTSENDVYLNPDGKTVTKVNNLGYVKGAEQHHNLNALIDRLAAHNVLFPNVSYSIKGFIDNKNGDISLVMEQPYVDAQRNATKDEIESYLSDKGLSPAGPRAWSNGHEVWSNGVYELFDARPANVLKGKDGKFYFIDTFPHSVVIKDLLSGEKLSGNNFDTSTNNRKFASYEDKGSSIPKRVPQAQFGSSDEVHRRIQEASAFIRGRVEAARKEQQGSPISQREVRDEESYSALDFAKKNGLWIEDIYELASPFPGGGNENTLAYDQNNQIVYKSNNLLNHNGSISDFLDYLQLHNRLFPETKYALVGFTGIDNGKGSVPYIEVVLKQDYIPNAEQATQDEITTFMESIGFKQEGNAHTFSNGELIVSDMRPRNVLKDRSGTIHVIDNIVRNKGEENQVRFQSVSDVADVTGSSMTEETRKELDKKLKNTVFKIREAWEDRHLAVKEFQDLLRSKGVDIAEHNDYYKQATHINGKNDAQLAVYNEKLQRPVNDSIRNLEAAGLDYRAIENYVILKHGLERNAWMRQNAINEFMTAMPHATQEQIDDFTDSLPEDYAGITAVRDETGVNAEDFIAEFEKKAGSGRIDVLWSAVKAATQFSLSKQMEGGIIDKKTYEELVTRYEYYIPLRGHDAETAENRWNYSPNMGTYFVAPLIKAKGRKTRSESPFAYIATMAQSAINSANKNTLNQTILRLARKDATGLMSVSQTWYVQDGYDSEGKPTYTIQSPTYSENPQQYRKNLEDFEERMEILEASGQAFSSRSRLNIGGLFIKRDQADQHEIHVFQNGKEYTVYINANPAVARAINGANTKDLHKELQFIANVSRQMSANFTTRNPVFVVSNFLRDFIFSSSILPVKEDTKYALQFHRNVPNAAGALQRHLRGKGDLTNKYDNYAVEYIMNGAKTGFSHIVELQKIQKQVEREIKKGEKKSAVRHLLDALSSCNDFAENLSRLSVYITSREQGRSVTQSISDAKEVTVNFNRSGAGGYGSQWVRPLFLFVNAGIQALSNFAKVAQKNKAQTAMLVSAYAMTGFIMPTLCILIGGDDGHEEYMKMSDWERQNKLCIYTGSGFIKIPLPHELRVFHKMGDEVYQTLFADKDITESILDVILGFADLIPANPMGAALASASDFQKGGAKDATKTAVSLISPDMFKPFAQLAANRNFTGSPITKENQDENKPGYLKIRTNKRGEAFAPAFLVKLLENADNATGGDGVKKGLISLNPDDVNHLIRGYFGGLYSISAQGLDIVSKTHDWSKTGGSKLKVRETPLRAFYTSSDDLQVSSSGLNSRYYKISDSVRETDRLIKGYQGQVKEGKLSIVGFYDKIKNIDIEKHKALKECVKEITKLEKSLKDLNDSEQKQVEKIVSDFKNKAIEIYNTNNE